MTWHLPFAPPTLFLSKFSSYPTPPPNPVCPPDFYCPRHLHENRNFVLWAPSAPAYFSLELQSLFTHAPSPYPHPLVLRPPQSKETVGLWSLVQVGVAQEWRPIRTPMVMETVELEAETQARLWSLEPNSPLHPAELQPPPCRCPSQPRRHRRTPPSPGKNSGHQGRPSRHQQHLVYDQSVQVPGSPSGPGSRSHKLEQTPSCVAYKNENGENKESHVV